MYIEIISIVLSPLPQVYHDRDCVVVQQLFVCQSGGISSLVVSLFTIQTLKVAELLIFVYLYYKLCKSA